MNTKKITKKQQRRIRFKRYGRKNRNNTRYMYSRALQTMGVGTAKVRVTRFYSYLPNTIGTNQNFVSEMVRDSVASQEFNRFAQDFSYTKLKKITVTCVPNSANSSSPVFLKFDWIDGDSHDITFDDNAKLIWQTTMKPITYKFKPPNILLNNLDPEKPIKINYREWQDSKTLVAENIPGYLKVTTPVVVKLITEAIWVFRGYNAKFPYVQKEIVNNNGKDVKTEDEIGEIINDLKILTMKKDDLEEEEEKIARKRERKEKRVKKMESEKDRKNKDKEDVIDKKIKKNRDEEKKNREEEKKNKEEEKKNREDEKNEIKENEEDSDTV